MENRGGGDGDGGGGGGDGNNNGVGKVIKSLQSVVVSVMSNVSYCHRISLGVTL